MADWKDTWMDPTTGAGARVSVRGKLGTVVGCIEYELEPGGRVTRELQVAMDSAEGSSFTHWRVEDCTKEKK